MKRKLCTLFILSFIVILLSYSFAVASDTDLAKGVAEGVAEDAKQDAQKKKQKEFDEKLNVLLKKLPAAAKVVVLEFKVKAPEFDTPLSDNEAENSRKKTIKTFESIAEEMKDSLEEHIEALGITVVDRDAFKDIEKEIIYAQIGEVDPSTSAEFGKKIGATHLLIGKIILNGFKTGHPAGTLSIKIIDVESSKRFGTANIPLDFDQPKESTSSQSIQKQTLVDESFNVDPGTDKVYSQGFPVAGSLDISLTANSDVLLYIVDNGNYEEYAAGRGFRGFAIKERITSANFSVSVPKGLYYIVVSNKHSVFTSAGVVLSVSYTPEQ